MKAKTILFNMNWFEFTYRSTGVKDELREFASIKVYPNPTNGILCVEGSLEDQLGTSVIRKLPCGGTSGRWPDSYA
jgi:hypothetical protein